MALYLVTYDLMRPGQNYTNLFQTLQSVPHCHALQSVWFIKHPGDSSRIRDWLRPHIDANDKLFVCLITDWASLNVACGTWLNQQ